MASQRTVRTSETTTTTGTGTLTLLGAETAAQAFSVKFANGDTCDFVIEAIDGSGVPTGLWERSQGAWATGGTLTRATVVDSSSGAGVAVSFIAGTKRVYVIAPGGCDIQTFQSGVGTWTKPIWATTCLIQVMGGGGGGGSGQTGATSTTRLAGGGGGGAGFSQIMLPATLLGATETVTVGAGGAAGAAVATSTTIGNIGGKGGTTTFGTWIAAQGGLWGGGGNNNTNGSGYGGQGMFQGGAGQVSNSGGGADALRGLGSASGGAYGRGINSSNLATIYEGTGGGDPTYVSGLTTSGGGGVGGPNPGNNATNRASNDIRGGKGGGGGAAAVSAAGTTGGNGGFPGGGAGGGGAALDTLNSGAGGVGGAGLAIITSY